MQFFLMGLAVLLNLLPHFVFRFLANILGSTLELCNFRRKILLQNLEYAFPRESTEAHERLIKANYQHYGLLFLEFLRSFAFFPSFLRTRCRVEGEDNLRTALAEGKGIFVMTAHLGNWELLPAVGASVLKVPVTMVTKKLKPAWLHQIIESTRLALGVRMAFEPQTMRVIMRALREGGVVGFAIDQFAGAPVGARVPFFGHPVGSHTALATLAARTGAPVVPGLSIRQPDGSFVVRFEKPLPFESAAPEELGNLSRGEAEVIKNTAAYTSWVEERVREYPEQWLWIHRRWKGDLSPLPSKVLGELLK